jgi:hypothetical protein
VLAGLIRDVPPARAASRMLLWPVAQMAEGLLAVRTQPGSW